MEDVSIVGVSLEVTSLQRTGYWPGMVPASCWAALLTCGPPSLLMHCAVLVLASAVG